MDKYELRHAIYRGLWHFIGGSIIAVATILLPNTQVLIYLSIVTMFFLSFEFLRFKSGKINNWFINNLRFLVRTKEKSSFVGSTYFLLSSVFVIALFSREISVLAIFFLSLGDPAATIFGGLWGRTKFPNGKSLEGSLACLFLCLIIGFIIQWAAVLSVTVPIIIGGSIAATLSEFFFFKMNDNLAMPISAASVMWILQSLGV